MTDWIGDTNSIFKTLGASSHGSEARENNDFYATDPKALYSLINEHNIVFNSNIWECACGAGNLSEVLKEYNYNVYSSDLVDHGYGTVGVDFLRCINTWDGDIITNPPYKYAQEFIEHALDLITDGNHVYMFLKIQFLEGKKRKALFDSKQLKTVYISRSRIECGKNNVFTGGSAVAYAWFDFEKGYNGDPVIKWFN